jgi:hypothetical protein
MVQDPDSDSQGYTKFSNFGDLDALSDDDWDKVSRLWKNAS